MPSQSPRNDSASRYPSNAFDGFVTLASELLRHARSASEIRLFLAGRGESELADVFQEGVRGLGRLLEQNARQLAGDDPAGN